MIEEKTKKSSSVEEVVEDKATKKVVETSATRKRAAGKAVDKNLDKDSNKDISYFVDEDRIYEVMMIIDSELTEKKIKDSIKSVKTFIEKELNGKIIFEDDTWGVKEFCYRIKKKTHGYYILFNIEIKGTKVDELNRQLELENSILRHLIIKLPKGYKPEKYEVLKSTYEIETNESKREKEKEKRNKNRRGATSRKPLPVKEAIVEKVVAETKKEEKIDEDVKEEVKPPLEETPKVAEEVEVEDKEKIKEVKKDDEKKKEKNGDHLKELNDKLDKLLLSDDLGDL